MIYYIENFRKIKRGAFKFEIWFSQSGVQSSGMWWYWASCSPTFRVNVVSWSPSSCGPGSLLTQAWSLKIFSVETSGCTFQTTKRRIPETKNCMHFNFNFKGPLTIFV